MDTNVYETAVPLKYRENSSQNIRGYTDIFYSVVHGRCLARINPGVSVDHSSANCVRI